MRLPPGRLVWLAVLGATSLASPGCSSSAAPRAEVVFVLDTDAPVVGELATHPELSEDSAVDTVRVDILDASNAVTLVKSFLAPELESWPLSFGVVPPADGEVRVRIRLFRALFASAGMVDKVAVLDPPIQTTIDRFVQVTATGGLQRFRVLLTEDCLGTPSSFLSPQTTCVDANDLAAPPTSGLQPVSSDHPQSVAGTWAPASEVPCAATAPPTALCIPGGFSIVGESGLAGQSDTHGYDPVPLRPAIVSPFFLDKTEYTVGRLRSLLARGTFQGNLPTMSNGTDPATSNFCTWLGPTVGTNDRLPLNCMTVQMAMQACQADGGTLPSEAQWEHAARGRGQRRLFPWGDEDATCCAASVDRQSTPGFVSSCTAEGIEPVGSHTPTSACNGLGDVSRDGVLDLDGSLTEAMADALDPYDAPCWTSAGILHDPLCTDAASPGTTGRGSNWLSGITITLPTRFLFSTLTPQSQGFRCVYPDKGSP
jgi:formylglycine-generating enzyme required for sulfatase activity